MPTIDTLLVDRGPGETRVAALAGNHVIEVYHHRIGLPAAGALYRGRVGKPLPGAQAVFVDIGLESADSFGMRGESPERRRIRRCAHCAASSQ